jgi:glycosyltransferase involved in cell wall biosynthesis
MGKHKRTTDINVAEQRCKTRRGHFKEVPVITHENGSLDLVLPKIPEQELKDMLPKVSVVTITKNRGMFAGIMLHNWVNITYPRDKLEWVVVDDSDDTSEYDLADYIPQDDPYIKYVKLDRHYPVAEKRNKAVELASNEIIVHMDDDDYYFPDSVLAKVRVMLHYKCQGVHSMPIGVYDMMEKSSYIFDSGRKTNYSINDCAEATLAYRKDYWENNKFYSLRPNGTGEGRSIINKRFEKWVKIHFMFNMISVTHSKNITGNNRRLINDSLETVKTGRFQDVFPPSFNTVLDNVYKMLMVDYKTPNRRPT